MSARRVVFANDEIYHVFNRSIERQPIFTDIREYKRAAFTLKYYRFKNPPLKLSKALVLEKQKKEEFFQNLTQNSEKLIEILSYCLMPNHFHFLLKQKLNNGISKFISNFTDSYTRYFNIRRKRKGPICEGTFKAVHIETNEQLLHVSRYIHINPVVSLLVSEESLDEYPWSSFSEFLGKSADEVCEKTIILDSFSSKEKYRQFVHDQIDYGKRLETIKHLILEEN